LAKKKGRPQGSGKVVAAAETVGGTLGSLMGRVDAWMKQRDQLAADLRAMADNIATGAINVAGAVKTAGAKAIGQASPPRKRPAMSAEARAKIAAAQRARWAKQKSEAGAQAPAPAATAKKAKKARKK
jgi:hypothetical protein